MSKQLSLANVLQLFFVKVEKCGEGWRAVVFALDQQQLAQRLKEVADQCVSNGMPVPPQAVTSIRTDWLYQQTSKGFPQFITRSRNAVDAKCTALSMLMYGSKPSHSYTWDCMKKADIKLLDRVTGICGESTMVYCKEISGLRIPFSLPAPGKIPTFMPKILAKFCANNERGLCSMCQKRSFPGVVFGKVYPCGNFVHDMCALHFHFDMHDNRAKKWSFVCSCAAEHDYTSPSRLFTPLRLTITTGDNVPALEANMDKYRKNGDDPVTNLPGFLLAKAIRSMLLNLGIKKNSININNIEDQCMFFLKMPDRTKAGAWFQDGISEFSNGGIPSKNKQNPYKSEVEVIAGHQCLSYIQALKEKFYEFVYEDGELKSKELAAFCYERILVHKMNTKVEALVVQDDADKLRMFFPSHVCKFIFDNVIWKNLVQRLYMKGAVMLGFRWLDGGAQKLYERYGKFSKIFAWDISGLDSSMKAKVIQIIFESLFKAFNPDSVNDVAYRLFTLLYIICTGHYISKVVAWVDSFRIMVGSMASGELLTSIFNTIYCIVAIFSWIHHIADIKFGVADTAAKLRWIDKNLTHIVLYIFGDDGLMATNAEELSLLNDVVCNGKSYPSLDKFLKVHWKMSIKRTDSLEANTMLSVPDDIGDLPKNSITILKRGFVKTTIAGVEYVGPFKSTSISVGKLLKHEVPANKQNDLAYSAYLMMCRAVGHAVDTAGMNKYMYDICKYVYDAAYSTFTSAVGVGSGRLKPQDMLEIEDDVVGDMLQRFTGEAHVSHASYSIVSFPLWEDLQQMFIPPREYVSEPIDAQHARRQKHFNYRMYEHQI